MQNYPDAVAIRAGAANEGNEGNEIGVTTLSLDSMVDGYDVGRENQEHKYSLSLTVVGDECLSGLIAAASATETRCHSGG